MKIDIATEDNNAHFDFNIVNFPARFTFLDRMSHSVIEVNLDFDTFVNLLMEMEKRIKISQIIKNKIDRISEDNESRQQPSG